MNQRSISFSAAEASRLADEAIAEFLQAVEVGEAPDRSRFVREHNGIQTALESFFDAYDQIDNNAKFDTNEDSSFVAGSQLGRHNLVRPIGSGSFGTVWLGFDSKLKRPVAIKVPNLDRFSSRKQRDLFLREAQTVAQLDHPNIVPVYDVGETDDGHVYLVSRFIAGNDLASEAQERQFSFNESASCLADIASALDYAHGRDVIHRDVKPSNILIEAVSKQAYITDFGLACVEDRADGTVTGTPAYMSPEQASGNPVDHRTDVFSLGVVLFELLYGQRPFAGKDARELMEAIREDLPDLPNEGEPPVPDALQSACLKSLSKPLDQRYGSSKGLESDLRSYLSSQPGGSYRSAITDAGRSNQGQSRGLAWGVVGILAAIAVGWLLLTWLPTGVGPNTAGTSKSTSTSGLAETSIDREIAIEVIELGGHIDFSFENEDYEVDTVEAIPDGDISLLWIMFDNFQTIDNDFFGRLRLLDSLEGIDLATCKFSDAGFMVLQNIETLRYVHAPDCGLSDRAFASLATLPKLRQVTVASTEISDQALLPFEGHETMRVLRLGGTRVTDEGLRTIGTMPNLQELTLVSCQITDEGIKHLATLSNLRVIKLSETRVTGKLFETLGPCPLNKVILSSKADKSDAEKTFMLSHPECQIVRE
jgi:serine/threonine protein kinase